MLLSKSLIGYVTEIPLSGTVPKNASGIVWNCLFSVELTNEELFSSITANLNRLKFQ